MNKVTNDQAIAKIVQQFSEFEIQCQKAYQLSIKNRRKTTFNSIKMVDQWNNASWFEKQGYNSKHYRCKLTSIQQKQFKITKYLNNRKLGIPSSLNSCHQCITGYIYNKKSVESFNYNIYLSRKMTKLKGILDVKQYESIRKHLLFDSN